MKKPFPPSLPGRNAQQEKKRVKTLHRTNWAKKGLKKLQNVIPK